MDNTNLLSVNSLESLPQNEGKLYSVREMAEYCHVNTSTISRAIKTKCIGAIRSEVRGRNKTALYSADSFEVIRNQLAKNQLNQGKNSTTGKAAVKEVVTNKIDNEYVTKNDLIAIIPEIISQTVKALLPTIQQQKVEAPKMDPRAKVTMLVRKESKRANIPYEQVYSTLYTDFGYRTHSNPAKLASNRGMKTIDYIESIGKMNELAATAEELFSNN